MLCRKIDFIVSMKKAVAVFFINVTDFSRYNRPNTESIQSYYTVCRLPLTGCAYINCCLFMVHGSWCQRVTLWPSPKSSLRQDDDETSTIWPSLLHLCPCIITRPILYAGQQFNGNKKNTMEPLKSTYTILYHINYVFIILLLATRAPDFATTYRRTQGYQRV